ncbi:MAG TPA: hypothetical protein VFF24_07030, partial [Acidimicrobiia bacterium]|nr:hypothetical protein [Acidimicrobiia bacterium]
DPAALSYAAIRFGALAEQLRGAGIAHGDLQHGNILVAPGGDLRLVDYDGMWVPELDGLPGNELGHRNYAHPRRTRDDFGPAMDAFPSWVVYASLAALSIDPLLWGRLDGGDECLLFRAADFADPAHSEALACLEAGGDPRLVALAQVLRRQAARPVAEVEPLSPSTAPPPGTGDAVSLAELRERQSLLEVLRTASETKVEAVPPAPVDVVVGPERHRRREGLAAVVRRFRGLPPVHAAPGEPIGAEARIEELGRRRAQVDADEQAAVEDDRRAEADLRHREQVELRAIDEALRRTLADLDTREHELSRAERHERADALRALHAHILDGELARHPLASARGAVTDKLVYALALDDVRTAADIADIRTGEEIVLVRRDGREVRIAALGPSPAASLLRWRGNLERRYEHLLPDRLPPEREAVVSEAYAAKRAGLEDEMRRARADAVRRADEVRAGAQAERDRRAAVLAQRKQEAAARRLDVDRELSRARKEHAEARFRSEAAAGSR